MPLLETCKKQERDYTRVYKTRERLKRYGDMEDGLT